MARQNNLPEDLASQVEGGRHIDLGPSARRCIAWRLASAQISLMRKVG